MLALLDWRNEDVFELVHTQKKEKRMTRMRQDVKWNEILLILSSCKITLCKNDGKSFVLWLRFGIAYTHAEAFPLWIRTNCAAGNEKLSSSYKYNIQSKKSMFLMSVEKKNTLVIQCCDRKPKMRATSYCHTKLKTVIEREEGHERITNHPKQW